MHELVSDDWVVVVNKRTGKGSDLHISINPRKTNEIVTYLQEDF